MATRKPLIVNPAASQIQELPAGDSVDGIATLTATTLVGNGVVPVGGIIMWSGTIASLTSSAPNFKLCDGNNGTPDLTNKFIIGAISDQSVSGITTAATTITGSNTRDGGTKDAIVPDHTHSTSVDSGRLFHQGGQSNTINFGGPGLYPGTVFSMNNPSDGESVTNKNLPPYYALAYIMRVS